MTQEERWEVNWKGVMDTERISCTSIEEMGIPNGTKMRELVKFVYTKENLNFIVYASYFLFLFISTFKNLQSSEPLLSDGIDVVVAKSFLVFIACTNMLDRKRSSNLEGGELLSLFVKMMMVHDDEKWRVKRKKHQLEG